MKYKNRLIVPTIVTLSLLGVSANAEAEQVNNDSSQEQESQEFTYNNSTQKYNDETSQDQPVSDDSVDDGQTLVETELVTQPVNQQEIKSDTNDGTEPSENNSSVPITSKTHTNSEKRDSTPGNQSKKEYTQDSKTSTEVSENPSTVTVQEGENQPANLSDAQSEKKTVEKNDDSTIDNDEVNKNKVHSKSSLHNNSGSDSTVEQKSSGTDKHTDESTNKSVDEEESASSDREEQLNAESEKESASVDVDEAAVTEIDSEDEGLKTGISSSELDDEVHDHKSGEKSDASEKSDESEETSEEIEQKDDLKTGISSEMDDDEVNHPDSVEKSDTPEKNDESEGASEEIEQKGDLKTASVKSLKLDETIPNKLMAFNAASSIPVYDDASFAAKLKSSKNSGLYSPVTSNDSVNANFLLDETMYIDKYTKHKGDTYYRVHRELDDRMQGWIKKDDLKLFEMWVNNKQNKKYQLSNTNGNLLNSPWGTKEQSIKSLRKFNTGTPFQSQKSVKIGQLRYMYGKIGSDYGWIQDKLLDDYTGIPVESAASYAARLNSSISSGLYSPVTSDDGVNGNFLRDQTVYIDKKAVYDGEAYYRVNREYGDRMQGWVKEDNLSLYKMFPEKNHKKTYELSSRSGNLLSDPWGTNEQSIMKLTNFFTGTTFQAQKAVKIGALNFYYGKLGSTYGWINDYKLKEYTPVAPSPTVKTVRHSQNLTQAVNTQMNLSSKPQAWANNGGWRNATRNEVRRFLDTSHQTSETWMYTFLDLDRSQNIASSALNNKLLHGKGTLSNQGSAFLNAANTQGINEVYLISHALHETGNGKSTLAQGVKLDADGSYSSNGKKYYNMYGIGAYDYNPVLAGARYAQQMGWDTPAKAIVGGARFISQSYFNRGQTTLYSMRWNPSNPGTYQYATDVNWAYATARNLQNYYNQLDIKGRYYTKHIF